jgi:hypothetical protein
MAYVVQARMQFHILACTSLSGHGLEHQASLFIAFNEVKHKGSIPYPHCRKVARYIIS